MALPASSTSGASYWPWVAGCAPVSAAFCGISVGSRSGARLPRLFGSILGSALGLNVGGVEDAVASELAFGQRLRVVLEGVGRSLGPAVNHREGAVLLHQQELQVGALALDRAGNNIAGYAQPLAVRAVPMPFSSLMVT